MVRFCHWCEYGIQFKKLKLPSGSPCIYTIVVEKKASLAFSVASADAWTPIVTFKLLRKFNSNLLSRLFVDSSFVMLLLKKKIVNKTKLLEPKWNRWEMREKQISTIRFIRIHWTIPNFIRNCWKLFGFCFIFHYNLCLLSVAIFSFHYFVDCIQYVPLYTCGY